MKIYFNICKPSTILHSSISSSFSQHWRVDLYSLNSFRIYAPLLQITEGVFIFYSYTMLVNNQMAGLTWLPPTITWYGTSSTQSILGNTQNRTQESINSSELIDTNLLWLIEKIPYHSWGWAISITRTTILELIPKQNYSTLVAICQKLIDMPEKYWNDNRDRDFSGIMESITNRLWELGYEVSENKIQHYIDNTGEKRIHLPQSIKKIS